MDVHCPPLVVKVCPTNKRFIVLQEGSTVSEMELLIQTLIILGPPLLANKFVCVTATVQTIQDRYSNLVGPHMYMQLSINKEYSLGMYAAHQSE